METYKVAVSTVALSGKPPKGDPLWKSLSGTFVNREVSMIDLVNEMWLGHTATTWHSNNWRHKRNFLLGQHLGLDFDTGDKRSSLETVSKDPFVKKHASFLYETFSARPQDGVHRIRAIFLLDTPIHQPTNYALAAQALLWLFGTADPSGKDPCRQWFGTDKKEVNIIGNTLPLALMREIIVAYQETGKRAMAKYVAKPFNGVNDDAFLDRLCTMVAMAGVGQRNTTLTRQAFIAGLAGVSTGKLDQEWTKHQLLLAAKSTGLDDKEASECIARSIDDGIRANVMGMGLQQQ